MTALARLLAAVVGSCVEAWSELRVHRGRVLLSLIGVGVAVTALTGVVAAGSIAQQAMRESSERAGGRAATLSISAYSPSGAAIDAASLRAAFDEATARYGITWASEVSWGSLAVQFTDGRGDLSLMAVDRGYAEMHRLELIEGAWFDEADAARLAPALVINEHTWERLGSPDPRTRPTVTIKGERDVVGVVVGVTPAPSYDTSLSAYMLADQYAALAPPTQFGQPPQFEAWVPEGIAEDLRLRLQSDMASVLGDGAMVDVFRSDFAEQNAAGLEQMRLIVGGIALVVLLLGALGLVNIALVTVRTRIREIGIRRTFGASASRVFFAVLMESVVATVVAGFVGVLAAVLLVQNPWAQDFIGQDISDLPPFPVEAAVTGIVAATAVGALAGLLPALVALRVKVIDAIRY